MNVSWYIPKVFKSPFGGYNYNKMSASSWIRCLQLIPYLKKLGVNVSINKSGKETDIAIFLRRWEESDFHIAERLRKNGVRIVVDTPVNYFSDQDLPAFAGGIRTKFRKFADIANMILCPSEYIAQFGREKGYNILCIEDSIDLKHFCYSKKQDTTCPLSLIWAGVSVKAIELNFLAPAIKSNGWRFTIISEKRPSLDFNYEFIKWDHSTFPGGIIKGNLGVFPRQCENEYDLGHSFFKIGVFSALHVPVICSPVPSYKKIATVGNSKILDSMNQKEWEKAIQAVFNGGWEPDFSKNPVENFSTANIAERYLGLFSNLIS